MQNDWQHGHLITAQLHTFYFTYIFYLFSGWMDGWRKSFPLLFYAFTHLKNTIKTHENMTKIFTKFYSSHFHGGCSKYNFPCECAPDFLKRSFSLSLQNLSRKLWANEGAMRRRGGKIIFNYPHYDDVHCEA